MNRTSRIYIAGHRGLVGSALWRELHNAGYENLLGHTRAELDLTQSSAVRRFFQESHPEYVVLAAAKVGGIRANETFPADFIHQNLEIQNSVIHAAYETGVKRLIFLGSTCIFPKHAPQPLREEYLLSGPLEATNQWYAIAKIAGWKMCEAYRRQHGCDFITVLPTNLYGPNDNYDPENSHVLPALIRRFHEAKANAAPSVTCWGSGTPRREFLYSDDLARALILLLGETVPHDLINAGVGTDSTIAELADRVRSVIGYKGEIVWDTSRPDGTPRKLVDCSRINALGWRPAVDLDQGIRLAYEDFLKRFG